MNRQQPIMATNVVVVLKGLPLIMAQRAQNHASIEERAVALQASTQSEYDASVAERAHSGQLLVQRMMDYDLYASVIMNRDTRARRALMRRIQAFLARKYRIAFENAEDDEFRTSIARLFELASRRTRMGNDLQMYIIHVAVLLEPEIARFFCPAPPDPDDEEAHDEARVDRLAFTIFQQRYLLPAFVDLLDGATLGPKTFVYKMNGAYTALLPSSPVDALVRATRHRRRVDFRDAEARERVSSLMT